jgi:5'-3' exonuclease
MAKKFGELGEVDNSRVLIVDALNVSFKWKHLKQWDFADDFLDFCRSLARSYKCGRILITADKGSSSYRKEIFPDYKGNRKDLQEKQTEQEKQDFEMFIQGYNDMLEIAEDEGYTVLAYQGVEADDIAAYLVKYKNDFGFGNIFLVSSDKDWDLLLNHEVQRFSHMTRKDYTLDTWVDRYEFHHDDYISYKCLTGDAGDNVPGVNGVGDKRATQLIEQYGSVFDIYDQLPLPGKQKFVQNLNDFGEQLLTNVELMDLLTYCDEAIGEDNIADIREKLND